MIQLDWDPRNIDIISWGPRNIDIIDWGPRNMDVVDWGLRNIDIIKGWADRLPKKVSQVIQLASPVSRRVAETHSSSGVSNAISNNNKALIGYCKMSAVGHMLPL